MISTLSLATDNITRASMSFHSKVDSGTTINRFSQDISLIDMELPAYAFALAICEYFTTNIVESTVALVLLTPFSNAQLIFHRQP
jgi:hypothetical protein